MKNLLYILLFVSPLIKGQLVNACFSPITGNTVSTGTYPNSIFTTDFNNDGNADLAVSCTTPEIIGTYLGNGAGSFTSSFSYSLNSIPNCVISADFNNDGNKDIAVNCAPPYTNLTSSVSILLGNGVGSFSFSAQYTVGISSSWLTSGDFNNDSNIDLASTNASSNDLTVLFGGGNGTFTSQSTYSVGTDPKFVISGYLNTDSYLDLVIVNQGSNNLSVLLGNSSGTFSNVSTYSVGNGPKSATLFNFNNDGHLDIAVSCYSQNNIVILQGSSSGTFASTYTHTGVSGRSIVSGDFNSDAKIDLAIGDCSFINTLLATGNGSFTTGTITWGGNCPNYIVTGDFNNDLKGDLATANYLGSNFSVLLNALPSLTIAGLSSTVCGGTSVNLAVSGASTYIWSNSATTNSIQVSPFSTSTYTVKGFAANGCSNIAVTTVSVNPSPTINVNTGNVCPGNSFTFNPTGAVSYTLSSGANVITPSVSSSYTTWGTGANGCISHTQTYIYINPSPTITVNSGSICVGKSFTLSPSGANSYTYSSGGAIVTPSTNSTYSVFGTSYQGCISSNTAISSVTVYATPTIGLNSGSVCAGSAYTISPTGGTNYTYSTGSAIFIPSTSITYSVTGNNSFNCTSTATSNVFVQPLPSISVNSGSICVGQQFTFNPSGAVTYTYSGGSSIVSPTVTSFYTITGTDQYGCHSSNSASALIIVYQVPLITVNSGTICPNESFTLSPSGASTYTFLNAGPIVNPSVTSVFSITGSSSMGCVSPTLATAYITVIPLPTITVNSGQICSGDIFTITPSGAFTYTFSSGSNTVSPLSSTNYFVTGANAIACLSTNTAIASVTVNALPTVSISSANSICLGSSANLLANGANSYTWSTGAQLPFINVSPSTNQIYSVSGTNAFGCKNSSSVTLYVNPLPLIKLLSSDSLICIGENVNISAFGASNYTWTNGSNATLINVSPLTNTTYSLNGTDSLGCENSASIVQMVDACTGIRPIKTSEIDDNIELYPNPNSGQFYIKLNEALQVVISNMMGEVVFKKLLNEGANSINLEECSNGIYFINFSNSNKKQAIKVIKH